MAPIRPDQKDRYPAGWATISFAIRFGRAEGRCECRGECGSPRHPGPDRCWAQHGIAHPVTGSKVVLTTAHLDHTPENVDRANLRAMCQLCHLAYDREHHAQTRAEGNSRQPTYTPTKTKGPPPNRL